MASPYSNLANLENLDLTLVESLFNHMPECPFFVKNRDLKYVSGNDAMLVLCGITNRGNFIGRSARDFFPTPLAERYETLDRKVIRTGTPVRNQLSLSAPRRSPPVWLLFARWPVFDHAGKVEGVAAVARNLNSPDRRHRKYERLAKVIEYMQSAFQQPIEVCDIARRAQVSTSQLKRDFVQLFGVSPQRYLTNIRIEAAMEMLREGRASIVEVAHSCGYADQSAFTRRFKLALGISPNTYRQREADQVARPI